MSLSLKKGLNNGTIGKGKNNVRIFPCKDKHGIFLRSNCVRENPVGGDPRVRRKRAMKSVQSFSKAASLKLTLASLVRKHKKKIHDMHDAMK